MNQLPLRCVIVTLLVFNILSAPAAPDEGRRGLDGHSRRVRALAYAPDGQSLASGSDDRTIRLWNVSTGEAQRVLTSDGMREVVGVVFSPDGKLIGACDVGAARLWESVSGKIVRTLESPKQIRRATSLAFSPNGQIMGVSGIGGVALWNATDWSSAGTMSSNTGIGIPRDIWCISFSRDGQLIATGAFGDPAETVELWDLAKRAPCAALPGHNEASLSVAFSPDGRLFATGDGFKGDGSVKLWSYPELRNIATLDGHATGIWSVAFSPNSRLVATGADEIMLWDAITGEPRFPFGKHKIQTYCVAFSPDGLQLASAGSENAVRLWRITESGLDAIAFPR